MNKGTVNASHRARRLHYAMSEKTMLGKDQK